MTKLRKELTKSRVRSRRRPIALLTDFGDQDHYVGAVKGVILSSNPDASIIDISHNVRPQNVFEAGYLLWASYKYFPDHTIFLCIVDPGVGSGRKIVCFRSNHHLFIAPDNGLLDLIVLEEKNVESFEITNPPGSDLLKVSATFHGRDIFAPLAAELSLGGSPNRYGNRIILEKPPPVFYDQDGGMVHARILHIDHFGNLITNIPARYFEDCTLEVEKVRVSTYIQNYAEALEGIPSLIVGSNGLIEIVVKNASAAKALRADLDTPIKVQTETISQATHFPGRP